MVEEKCNFSTIEVIEIVPFSMIGIFVLYVLSECIVMSGTPNQI